MAFVANGQRPSDPFRRSSHNLLGQPSLRRIVERTDHDGHGCDVAHIRNRSIQRCGRSVDFATGFPHRIFFNLGAAHILLFATKEYLRSLSIQRYSG